MTCNFLVREKKYFSSEKVPLHAFCAVNIRLNETNWYKLESSKFEAILRFKEANFNGESEQTMLHGDFHLQLPSTDLRENSLCVIKIGYLEKFLKEQVYLVRFLK